MNDLELVMVDAISKCDLVITSGMVFTYCILLMVLFIVIRYTMYNNNNFKKTNKNVYIYLLIYILILILIL